MSRRQLYISAVLLLLIIMVGVIVGITVGLEQAFNAALTAALVAVTAFYVYFTSQILRSTNQQAEIMRNAQYNAAAPVVILKASYDNRYLEISIRVSWKNIGKGPALNFRCWIEDSEHPELRVYQRAICSTAVEVALTEEVYRGSFRTEIPDYSLGVGYIRAQYESIFDITYESCLLFQENAAPVLKYGPVTERIIL